MTKQELLSDYGCQFYALKQHIFKRALKGLPKPSVRLLDHFGDEDDSNRDHGTLGCYSANTETIRIFLPALDSFSAVAEVLYHECRHHWQKYHRKQWVRWWLTVEHIDTYMAVYWTPLNAMEVDARAFAKTRGLHGNNYVWDIKPSYLEAWGTDGIEKAARLMVHTWQRTHSREKFFAVWNEIVKHPERLDALFEEEVNQ